MLNRNDSNVHLSQALAGFPIGGPVVTHDQDIRAELNHLLIGSPAADAHGRAARIWTAGAEHPELVEERLHNEAGQLWRRRTMAGAIITQDNSLIRNLQREDLELLLG